MRTVGNLKVALLFYKQRRLFVLTLCGIIDLHGFTVRLLSVCEKKGCPSFPEQPLEVR